MKPRRKNPSRPYGGLVIPSDATASDRRKVMQQKEVVMATKKSPAGKTRNPSSAHNVFVDRGHGIGRHSFNDTRIDPNRRGFRSVRQIIVTDTRGNNITEYDLDYRTVRPMSGDGERFRPLWTWAQVEAVVNRDLATIGKSFGDSYGAFYDSTTYGLYHGRRPSWYSEADWAKALLAGDRSRRKVAAKTRNPSPKTTKRKRPAARRR